MIQPQECPFTLDMTVSPEREEFVSEKLIEYNRAHWPLWEQNHDGQFSASPLHLYAVDASGDVIGGLIGRTHSLRAWLEIVTIWVSEPQRGRGIGRALMKQAEDEAVSRRCLYARLSTSDFQAPGFYEKLGYTLYGKLENCPLGETAYYYCKEL